MDLGEYDAALEILEELQINYQQLRDFYGLCVVFLYKAELFGVIVNQPQLGLQYCEDGLELAEQYGFGDLIKKLTAKRDLFLSV